MNPLFHARVPRGLEENLIWRRQVNQAAMESVAVREGLWQICSKDILFWVNTFCWTLDPRKLCDAGHAVGSRLPFITWDYQEEAFITLDEQLKRNSDALIEKSRDMGASWICCTWFLWRWLFQPHQSFLFASRKESLVDGDDDSLFSHVDFVLDGLPIWMLPYDGAKPAWNRTKLTLKNYFNGSVIEGESTTDNIGRGGRRTAILLDEFAAFEAGGFQVLSATADTTRCRVFNSTPKGTANAFYAQRESGTARVRMHWSRHPEKRRGLYRPIANGQFEFLDPAFDYSACRLVDEPPRSLEGYRSPWYDKECARRAHAWEIAQELDIDYQGSNYPFFDPRMLDELRELFCKAGTKGRLERSEKGVRFTPDPKGHLTIWCDLNLDRPPHDRDYIIGCDVSQGTGASDSAASVCDRLSGEKVAELVYNRWAINVYAQEVMMLAEFFCGHATQAEVIWEATGPGMTFGKIAVEQLKMKRFYVHKDIGRLGARQTQKYGWYSGLEGKRELLQTYREMLTARTFINPSHESIREAGFYVFEGGKIEYRGPTNVLDPSNTGANHGDRVIADALCAKLMWDYSKGRSDVQATKITLDPPEGSLAWRQKLNRERRGPDDRYLVKGEA